MPKRFSDCYIAIPVTKALDCILYKYGLFIIHGEILKSKIEKLMYFSQRKIIAS
jgi:hypothetical protein